MIGSCDDSDRLDTTRFGDTLRPQAMAHIADGGGDVLVLVALIFLEGRACLQLYGGETFMAPFGCFWIDVETSFAGGVFDESADGVLTVFDGWVCGSDAAFYAPTVGA